MKKRKWLLACILLVFGAMYMICYYRPILEEWEESHSGIPDVVSSISSGNRQYLKVVANSSRIDDKGAFARKVIQMCRENSFRTIRFSTDINGYPSGLEITVYLKRKDLEKTSRFVRLSFVQRDIWPAVTLKMMWNSFICIWMGSKLSFIVEIQGVMARQDIDHILDRQAELERETEYGYKVMLLHFG